jgi:hypothetical protein
MAVREVLICAKCGSEIEEDPLLGDRQGGVREIRHMGTTWRITLCVKDAAPLFELYEEFVEMVIPGGTAIGADALKYLPRITDDGPTKPVVPTFSEES